MTTGDLAKAVLAILPPRRTQVEQDELSWEGQELKARLNAAIKEYLASPQYQEDLRGHKAQREKDHVPLVDQSSDEELLARVAKLRLEKELPF